MRRLNIFDRKKIDVKRCARCGKNHAALEFQRFRRAPTSGFEWWALCPTTQEPILMKEISP
jgi:hypothetical protein